jgi:antitoxin component YwqK of YwqJK toxin-antitoxin module
MNKLISFIFLTILISCNGGQKQKVIDKWENGKNKLVLTYDNPEDTLTYLYEYFYENCKLAAKGRYINGKQDGLWEWWYENGYKKDEATIKQGVYIKQRKHWFANGKLKLVEIIKGKCIGECCDGQIISYYENGQIKDESTILDGVRTGKYIYRYENGQAKKEEYFNVGLKEGKYFEWYKDGTKWVDGFFKADKQDSLWTWYDTTGIVKSIQLFKEGEFIKNIK